MDVAFHSKKVTGQLLNLKDFDWEHWEIQIVNIFWSNFEAFVNCCWTSRCLLLTLIKCHWIALNVSQFHNTSFELENTVCVCAHAVVVKREWSSTPCSLRRRMKESVISEGSRIKKISPSPRPRNTEDGSSRALVKRTSNLFGEQISLRTRHEINTSNPATGEIHIVFFSTCSPVLLSLSVSYCLLFFSTCNTAVPAIAFHPLSICFNSPSSSSHLSPLKKTCHFLTHSNRSLCEKHMNLIIITITCEQKVWRCNWLRMRHILWKSSLYEIIIIPLSSHWPY